MEIKFKEYSSRRGVSCSNPTEISIYKRGISTRKKATSYKLTLPNIYVKNNDLFIRFGNLKDGRFFFATNNTPELAGNLRINNSKSVKKSKTAEINCKALVNDFIEFYKLIPNLDLSFKCYVQFDASMGVYVVGAIKETKYFNN
jgi:hypothetical protein